MKRILLSVLILSNLYCLNGQDLESFFDEQSTEPEFVYGTFKTSRIINGHSIENPAKNDLYFIISHRFGRLNEGAYNFFGLDYSTIRLGFDYGLSDRIAIGIGRSSYQKNIDGFLKIKLLRQTQNSNKIPVSLSWLSSIDVYGLKWLYKEFDHEFIHRLSYVNQIILARKFSSRISMQISPVFIHKNLVKNDDYLNEVFALGAGGRMKLTNRISLNAEYYYLITRDDIEDQYDSFSAGFDIETGGHVFQLHFTNSTGFSEKAFISETSGNWLDSDIHFGFNIKRVFSL
jgi:hypothetical protein